MENGQTINNDEEKRLERASTDRVLSGVSKGLADYFGIESIYVMFGLVALTMFGFFFIPIIYLILWLVLPVEGEEERPLGARAKENWEEVKQKLMGLFEQVRDSIMSLGLNN